jgi:hypothetical protein
MKISENKFFDFCTARVLAINDNYEIFDNFKKKFSKEEINEINYGLSNYFYNSKNENNIDTEVVQIPSIDSGFRSVIFKKEKEGNTQSIVLFSFKNFLLESWLPFIGVTIIILKKENPLLQIGEIAGKIWNNVNRLSRPNDNDCIDIIEEIIRFKTMNKINNNKSYPTRKDLKVRLNKMGKKRFEDAFSRLLEMNAIEIKIWGGQKDDFQNQDNHISIKI